MAGLAQHKLGQEQGTDKTKPKRAHGSPRSGDALLCVVVVDEQHSGNGGGPGFSFIRDHPKWGSTRYSLWATWEQVGPEHFRPLSSPPPPSSSSSESSPPSSKLRAFQILRWGFVIS